VQKSDNHLDADMAMIRIQSTVVVKEAAATKTKTTTTVASILQEAHQV